MADPIEIQPSDHEAIRAIGANMTRYIGWLADPEANRERTIAQLDACATEVPYGALFDEDTRLADEIDEATVDHSQLNEELRLEIVRLDESVRMFARKMPTKHKAAEAHAEQKKAAIREEAEAEKARLDAPRVELERERNKLGKTIDTVTAAWPVEPYAGEVAETAAEEPEEETSNGYEEPTELSHALESHLAGRRHQREWRSGQTKPQAEAEAPGPHAELADSIPSLSDRLLSQVSEHTHVYDGVVTAGETLLQALAKPEDQRSEQEGLLLKAIYALKTNFLEKPNDLGFLEVYEADDIISLAEQLHSFSRKNRPDFEGLEGRILEMAAVRRPMQGKEVPKPIQGAMDRMNEDSSSRKGMQWDSLVRYASRACDMMRAQLQGGGMRNTHLKDYVIDVVDRSGTKPDLSWVYQFVADEFAFSTLGDRRTVQQGSAKENFTENCEIISTWLAEVGSLLDQIPSDFRLRRHEKRKRNYRRRQRQVTYDSAPAGPRIRNTVKDIEVRRDGTGDSKTPRHKPMRLDPVGALNHQLRLGHMVDALKAELRSYDSPTEGRTEEITPFA